MDHPLHPTYEAKLKTGGKEADDGKVTEGEIAIEQNHVIPGRDLIARCYCHRNVTSML